jgi:hypothetical protein
MPYSKPLYCRFPSRHTRGACSNSMHVPATETRSPGISVFNSLPVDAAQTFPNCERSGNRLLLYAVLFGLLQYQAGEDSSADSSIASLNFPTASTFFTFPRCSSYASGWFLPKAGSRPRCTSSGPQALEPRRQKVGESSFGLDPSSPVFAGAGLACPSTSAQKTGSSSLVPVVR